METIRLCPRCLEPLPANAPEGLCPRCLARAALQTEPKQVPPAPKAPAPAEIAQEFPQLEVLEYLGRGGMGMVYKARQPHLDRMIALKLLPVQTGQDHRFADRFVREAKALARLSHPGIVTVYDFGQTQSYYFLLMEYVDGMNLRQLLRAQPPSPRQALELVMQICTALQFAHDEGIVHRDIKPENILITQKGQVKIADFGLAKLVGRASADESLTADEAVMGTLNYMAPEQRENSKQVDHRADIYSLGVVFYELLTGQVPLGRFAPPSRKVQVDVRLDEIVLRALEREPDRRYQHASEVKTGLEPIAASMPQPKPNPDQPRSVPFPPPSFTGYALTRFAVLVATWLAIGAGLYGVFGKESLRIKGPIPIEVISAPAWLKLGRLLLPLGLGVIVCAWLEARQARGLRHRDLTPDIRRQIRRHWLFCAFALAALAGLVALTNLRLGPLRTDEAGEWLFVPNSGRFEKLGLRAQFARIDQQGETYYQAPRSCVLGIVLHSKNRDSSVLNVTSPGLRSEYQSSNQGAGIISFVLDREAFGDWLQQQLGHGLSTPSSLPEADELYRLLKRYENAPPHTSDELLNAARLELRDYYFDGYTGNAQYQFGTWPRMRITLAWLLLGFGAVVCVAGTLWRSRRWYQNAWAEIAAGHWSVPARKRGKSQRLAPRDSSPLP
ncbi:MAG TPA: serine/threonine-protein kinase [Verrucomicrobiae bacterium]|nr:serine/threonine-protein kinase [Verrucomicrobiae bacterium]